MDTKEAAKMRVTLGFGKANLTNALATYASMKVTEPFVRVTAIGSGRKVTGGDTRTPLGNHEAYGAIITSSVEHDAGTIIMVSASHKRGASLIREGALFFRLRHGAPLLQVDAMLPLDQVNRIGDRFTIFSGYADLMTVAELKLLGVEVPRSWINRFMAPDELAECFVVTVLRPETIPRPQLTAVATADGIEMREVAQEPRRRLRLGSRGGS